MLKTIPFLAFNDMPCSKKRNSINLEVFSTNITISSSNDPYTNVLHLQCSSRRPPDPLSQAFRGSPSRITRAFTGLLPRLGSESLPTTPQRGLLKFISSSKFLFCASRNSHSTSMQADSGRATWRLLPEGLGKVPKADTPLDRYSRNRLSGTGAPCFRNCMDWLCMQDDL